MWQQGRIVSANNSYRAGEASTRSLEERDRSRCHSAHRGGLELSTGTGPYGACRSTQCCVAVWTTWAESSTRLGGFRALKNTLEAPYTTKVNYRELTSRGTTLCTTSTKSQKHVRGGGGGAGCERRAQYSTKAFSWSYNPYILSHGTLVRRNTCVRRNTDWDRWGHDARPPREERPQPRPRQIWRSALPWPLPPVLWNAA